MYRMDIKSSRPVLEALEAKEGKGDYSNNVRE